MYRYRPLCSESDGSDNEDDFLPQPVALMLHGRHSRDCRKMLDDMPAGHTEMSNVHNDEMMHLRRDQPLTISMQWVLDASMSQRRFCPIGNISTSER